MGMARLWYRPNHPASPDRSTILRVSRLSGRFRNSRALARGQWLMRRCNSFSRIPGLRQGRIVHQSRPNSTSGNSVSPRVPHPCRRRLGQYQSGGISGLWFVPVTPMPACPAARMTVSFLATIRWAGHGTARAGARAGCRFRPCGAQAGHKRISRLPGRRSILQQSHMWLAASGAIHAGLRYRCSRPWLPRRGLGSAMPVSYRAVTCWVWGCTVRAGCGRASNTVRAPGTGMRVHAFGRCLRKTVGSVSQEKKHHADAPAGRTA